MYYDMNLDFGKNKDSSDSKIKVIFLRGKVTLKKMTIDFIQDRGNSSEVASFVPWWRGDRKWLPDVDRPRYICNRE